jgi:hypothetical protein
MTESDDCRTERPPGGTVARAKRTDRAEARRRYRATLAGPDLDGDLEDDASTSAGGSATPERSAGSARSDRVAGSAPPQRPSILGAFRSSFRPVDLAGDVRALPTLLRHPAFLVPTVLSGLSVALSEFSRGDVLTTTFSQYFSGPSPLGAIFIAGFFAPRASWLVGALVALASVGFQALSFNVQYAGLPDNVYVQFATLVNSTEIKADIPVVLLQTLFGGVTSGIFFASAAAWYRRFLRRATPPRPHASGGSARRDGKVVKRNTERPILARRR